MIQGRRNPGLPLFFCGHNVPPPLVEIGLTDLPKTGWVGGGGLSPPPACDSPANEGVHHCNWLLRLQIPLFSLLLCSIELSRPEEMYVTWSFGMPMATFGYPLG
mgnify:CR=1 FL=1